MAHLNDRDRSISEAVVRVVAYARGLLSSVAKTRSIIAAATKIDPFPNTKPEGAPVDTSIFRRHKTQLAKLI